MKFKNRIKASSVIKGSTIRSGNRSHIDMLSSRDMASIGSDVDFTRINGQKMTLHDSPSKLNIDSPRKK